MSNESFANFDFSGFNGVLNGSDFNPVSKENISDRVINKTDRSGGKSFIGAVNKFVAENLEKQAKETRKALNPEKYGKEEMLEKLNQVEETLEEKKKDLVAMKAKRASLGPKIILHRTKIKTQRANLNKLDVEIKYLQDEIEKLQTAKKNIEKQMDSFSYGHYDAKSREDADYNMDYQKFSNGAPNHGENSERRFSSNEYLEQKLQRYLKKHPNAFKQDHQQSGRDDRPSL
ncbi:MAG: hypothetical protein IJU86_00050 [Firmicutes bacterium]|nr:hypothetical protein [Bacillota bacterium]